MLTRRHTFSSLSLVSSSFLEASSACSAVNCCPEVGARSLKASAYSLKKEKLKKNYFNKIKQILDNASPLVLTFLEWILDRMQMQQRSLSVLLAIYDLYQDLSILLLVFPAIPSSHCYTLHLINLACPIHQFALCAFEAKKKK